MYIQKINFLHSLYKKYLSDSLYSNFDYDKRVEVFNNGIVIIVILNRGIGAISLIPVSTKTIVDKKTNEIVNFSMTFVDIKTNRKKMDILWSKG